MAEIINYHNALEALLQRYALLKPHNEEVELQVWIDQIRGHYQLLSVGWCNDKRVHHCLMHFDLKDEKIWIQHNSTEVELDNELVALGVAPEHIVLGFIPEYRRPKWQRAA
ncbi:XisI protein [Beggiatoa alba B18LD]|uniref:XisI protein n=1 Tax=Beggiatoa alba B18LD TaxID=395493 RepID=I3CDV1_9GAMM|nr:XisI protein [Beggiatoa alba]EIJ41794.1 XisI protein [Beggiatoa alba B18LD]